MKRAGLAQRQGYAGEHSVEQGRRAEDHIADVRRLVHGPGRGCGLFRGIGPDRKQQVELPGLGAVAEIGGHAEMVVIGRIERQREAAQIIDAVTEAEAARLVLPARAE